MNTNITACNISMATLNFTSSRENTSSSLAITVTKSNIGHLIIGRQFTATVHSSQIEGWQSVSESAIKMVQSSLYISDSLFIGNKVSQSSSSLEAIDRSHVSIKHCTFKRNVGYSGAIYLYDSSYISIMDSLFEENMHPGHESSGTITIMLNSAASILRSNFSNNQAYEGAAIRVTHDSNIVVKDSVFTGNQACRGGAIAMAFDCIAQVEHSVFNANSAVNFHSKTAHNPYNISLAQSSVNYHTFPRLSKFNFAMSEKQIVSLHFINKTTTTSPHKLLLPTENDEECGAGAIGAVSSTQLNISDSVFLNNTSVGSAGAIVISSSILNITNSSFHDNTANGQAGAILVWQNSEAKIRRCIFLSNKALQVGALLVLDNSSLYIENSTFQRNSAKLYGGAISIVHTCPVIVTNCFFVENYAIQFGAISAQTNVSVALANCTFVGNTVGEYFAALGIMIGSTIHAEKCIFKNSRSRQCTVAMHEFSKGFIMGTKFINNTASDAGMIVA